MRTLRREYIHKLLEVIKVGQHALLLEVLDCGPQVYVTLHAKSYHLALKIIFEFIVPCYKHGNTGLIGEGFTHLRASVA